MDTIAMYCGYVVTGFGAVYLCLHLLNGIFWAWKELMNTIGFAYHNTKYAVLIWRIARRVVRRYDV